MKEWLLAHFEVQQGMYFDTITFEKDMVYFGSDHIRNSVWNYGMLYEISKDHLCRFVDFCLRIKKPCCLYVSRKDAEKNSRILKDGGFIASLNEGELVTETWMRFRKKMYSKDQETFNVELVSTNQHRKDFVDVFVSAYGGEKTPERPYGDLPTEYSDCVQRSFDCRKFFHFVCYWNGEPVSVATLCMSGSKGGLYNVGTKPKFERRGFGLVVTNACIDQWQKLHGKELFLQTETGSGIDDWYERIGFERVFEGVVYGKES